VELENKRTNDEDKLRLASQAGEKRKKEEEEK
jgi:hypothetical protein